MNYGIDKDELSFKLEDLSDYTKKGYTFQRKGDRTFVIRDGKVVTIVSNDTKLKDMKSLLNSSSNITGNFVYDEANNEKLDNFISEIESTTGRQVESVTFGPDGYEVVVDGEKVNVPYTENGSVNISDVTSRVSEKVTYKATDELNEDNKVLIENYLSQSLPDKYEVKVVLNDQGFYEVQIDGEVLTTLKPGATLEDAVLAVNNQINSGKALSDYNPSTETNKLRAKTGQNYKVHIDENAFKEVQSFHNSAQTIMSGCSGKYSANFTDKLATFYESIVGVNVNPPERIDKSVELLDNITINVKYSLQAYENIDKNLGMIFNSVVSEIFSMNSYADEETKEFYNKPLEEREAYLQNIIDTYQTQLDELKEEFKRKFGDGDIPLNWDEFQEIWPLLYSSTVINNCGVREDGAWAPATIDGKEVMTMDPANLSRILDYCEEHKVFENIEKYLNGEKFENTIGKWYFSTAYSSGAESIVNKETRENAYKYMENEFLRKCVEYMDPNYNQSSKIWGDSNVYSSNYRTSNDPDDYLSCKYFVRDILIDRGLGTRSLNNSYSDYGMRFKFNEMPFMTHAKAQMTEYERLTNDINGISGTIYNYKQYKGLLPYEAEMTGEKYLSYLVQDYSNLTGNDKLQYLDQRELALYQMYKSTKQEEKAKKYLEAMDDLINQRKGYQAAAERILKYDDINGFRKSGWDGFQDGLEQFFVNIGNCFAADGKRSADDYRNIFMVSLLGEENLYNGNISADNRFLLKSNYQIMSSIGQQAIPTLTYFIPVVGKVLSPVLQAAAAFGASRESALLSGASGAQSYMYATLSAVSTVVLNKCMSGIAGLNGGTEALTSVQAYLHSIPQQAARALLGTYLDGGIRSVVLGEPFDISKLTEQGFEAAIQGAFTAAIMNGTNSVLLKVANGVTFKVSRGQFGTYEEFCNSVSDKMWNTSFGQKVKALKAVGGDKWNKFKESHKGNVFIEMIESYSYHHSDEMPISIDKETAEKMGISLKEGESLVYDPNSNNYQRVTAKGVHYNIPADQINDYEGRMDIELTPEERKNLRWKEMLRSDDWKEDPKLASKMVDDLNSEYKIKVIEGIKTENGKTIIKLMDGEEIDVTGKSFKTKADMFRFIQQSRKNTKFYIQSYNDGSIVVNPDHDTATDTYTYKLPDGTVISDKSGNPIKIQGNKNRTMRKVVVGGVEIETNLTDDEIVKFYNLTNNKNAKTVSDIPHGYGIPSDISFVKRGVVRGGDGSYYETMEIAWNEYAVGSGSLPGATTENTTIKAGQVLTRRGNVEIIEAGDQKYTDGDDMGSYFSVGEQDDFDAIATPYCKGTQATTTYKVEKDISSSNIINDIEGCSDPDLKNQSVNSVLHGIPASERSKYYDSSTGRFTQAGRDHIKVKVGETGGAFGKHGGGTEAQTPLSTHLLIKLGYIKPIKVE